MTDFAQILADLRRPRLLVRAASHGLADYNRTRDLKRILGMSSAPSQEGVVRGLIDTEAQLESTRKAGEAGYSVTRHVEVLIALIAEARLLPQKKPLA